jgi:Fe-S cluster assembly protein SufD
LQIDRTIDLVVHPHASVTFLHDQGWDEGAIDATRITFHIHESSSLDAQLIISGGTSSKREIKIAMLGERASACVQGAYVLAGDQQLELSCVQLHQAPNAESNLVLKGALAGKAHATYTGTIRIEQCASGSNASQENKNILLSEHARALSVPNLEALTNDVRCAHGSAVGQLDAEQIWYMQTRGIPHAQAKKLLLQGFFADIVSANTDLEPLLEKLL